MILTATNKREEIRERKDWVIILIHYFSLCGVTNAIDDKMHAEKFLVTNFHKIL